MDGELLMEYWCRPLGETTIRGYAAENHTVS